MNKNERMIVVLLLALVVLVPSSLFVGYQYAVRAGPAIDDLTYGPGDVDTVFYAVFKDGTNYYAKNGVTRVVEYGPSTNCSDVVSDVLDAMIASTAGTLRYLGTLHFGKGIFEFDTQVAKMPPWDAEACLGPIIEGEGRYTTNLKAIGAHPVFNFTGTDRTNRFEAITIRSLEISSDAGARSAGDHGLIFVNATFVNIYDCYLYNAYDSAVYLSGVETDFIHDNGIYGNWGSGIEISSESDVHIFGNSISYNNLDGVTVASGSYIDIDTNGIFGNRFGVYFYSVEKSTITDNNIGVNDRDGIMFESNTENCTIANNVIFENGAETTNTYDGICLGDSSFNVVSGNRIFDEDVAPFQRWGIVEEGTSDYNTIVGDSTINGGATGGISVLGANTECHASYNLTVWVV